LTKPDGSVEHRQYKNGVKEGPAMLVLPDGSEMRYEYHDDRVDGDCTSKDVTSGVEEKFSYNKEGQKHGPAVEVT